MKRSIFEIKRNAVDRFYFIFKRPDDEIVAISQSFPDRAALEACISKIRNNAKLSQIEELENGKKRNPVFRISRDFNDEFIFTMVNIDGETIMRSDGFEKKEQCIDSIEYFKEYAQDAGILDLALE